MSRISERFAPLYTLFVAVLGIFAVLPIAPTQPAVASNMYAETNGNVRLAQAVIRDALPLSSSLQLGRNAATEASVRFTAALDSVPARLAQLPDRPFWIDGSGPDLRGELVAQTERLDIYVGIGTFSKEEIAGLAEHIEQILRDNEAWYGTRLSYRVSLGFFRPAASVVAGARGLAFTDQARAEVYFAEGESLDRALVVASHELAHHLQAQRYGIAVQKRADTILHEGFATWITGRRWLHMCGADHWKERARQLRDKGVPLRLLSAEQYGANNAYELWASFADYLVRQYGWEKVDALYASGSSRFPGSSDYIGILGKPLDEVASDWRAWVES